MAERLILCDVLTDERLRAHLSRINEILAEAGLQAIGWCIVGNETSGIDDHVQVVARGAHDHLDLYPRRYADRLSGLLGFHVRILWQERWELFADQQKLDPVLDLEPWPRERYTAQVLSVRAANGWWFAGLADERGGPARCVEMAGTREAALREVAYHVDRWLALSADANTEPLRWWRDRADGRGSVLEFVLRHAAAHSHQWQT